jgi:outer membrane cobalamin receptor
MTGYLLLITANLFSLVVYAQTTGRKIETGTIVNKQTNSPVEGATILFYPGKQATITNEQGSFSISRNAGYTDSITVTAIGHQKMTVPYKDFLSYNRHIALAEQVIELNSVTVALGPGEQYNVVSKLDIRMRDVNNSQEVLRLVPGLFIGQHAGGGKAEQLFLRGFDIDHGTDVNLSVDGMPVNMVSHAHGHGYADLHFLIPELIENVAFRKGPYYAEKGNLTTAGYVDFRTKSVLPSNLVKLEAGQFDTYRAVAMVNLLSKKMQEKQQHAFIASEYMYTNGYFDHPQDFKRLNIFGKYNGHISVNSNLDISVSTFSSRWNASGQIPERALQSGLIGFFGAIDPNEGGNTARTNVNARLQTRIGDGGVLKNQVYYSNYEFELYSNFTFFLNNNVDGDQVKQKEKRDLFGYNGSYTHTALTGDIKLTTEAGVGLRLDKTNNSELSRTRDRINLIQRVKLGDINELNTGVWFNETIQWTDRFSTGAGIRWDRFDVGYRDKLDNGIKLTANAAMISPKLNLYYQLSDKTQLYLTSGKGFHSNDTRVVVQAGGRKILPAAYGADLGIVLKPAPELLLQGALWYLKLDQEFVYVGDEGIVEPGGRTRRLGMDLSARYQPVHWLYVDVDVNYSRGRSIDDPKGTDRIPLAPIFTSMGGITYKGRNGVNASLRYRYMGDRPANEDNSVVAEGYFVTDAMVSYERKKFEVGLSAQNLFDVRWKETQFDTESKLQNETVPVSEIHFTPGTPLFLKGHVVFYF